jgi:hypothetical protein
MAMNQLRSPKGRDLKAQVDKNLKELKAEKNLPSLSHLSFKESQGTKMRQDHLKKALYREMSKDQVIMLARDLLKSILHLLQTRLILRQVTQNWEEENPSKISNPRTRLLPKGSLISREVVQRYMLMITQLPNLRS